MNISSHHIRIIILCIIFAIVTVGCAQQEPDVTNDDQIIDIHIEIAEPDAEEIRHIWMELFEQYMTINPEVHVHLDFISADASTRRSRITTALMSATAPDLFETKDVWAQADYRNGLLTDLTQHLEKNNPYDDNINWRESFDPKMVGQLTDPTNQVVSAVSLYSKEIMVVYNHDYFKKWHLHIPEKWDMFLDLQKQIKRHHVIPFAFANDDHADINFSWLVNILLNQIAPEEIKIFDLNEDNILQLNELVGLVDEGMLDFTQEQWHHFMPKIKAWSEFWPHDFHVLDHQSAIDMFLNGDAAMVLVDSHQYKQISSTVRHFEIGTFSLPLITDNAISAPNLNWMLDRTFSIPQEVQGERLETVVDILMFLTSQEVSAQFEKMNYRPTAESISDEFADERLFIPIFSPMIDHALHGTLNQIGQIYLNDTITLENYMTELNTSLIAAIEKIMLENNWDRSNEYGTIN